MRLSSLSEAIDWARSRWDEQRVAPVRLHQAHSIDGELGGPNFSHAMERTLDGRPHELVEEPRQSACFHWSRVPGELCLGCAIFDANGLPIAETGIYTKRVRRYRYPMTLALSRLQNALPIRRSYAHPYVTVVTLAEHGWDVRATAQTLDMGLDMAEAHVLRSLRMLHGRYEEGPVNTRTSAGPMRGSWVDLSDSQRNAIVAGESSAA